MSVGAATLPPVGGNINSFNHIQFPALTARESFIIRAQGRFRQNQITGFNIIQCGNRELVGTLVVTDSTEMIHVHDMTGRHVLTGLGGLSMPKQQSMFIFWPGWSASSEIIAYIDEWKITSTKHSGQIDLSKFKFSDGSAGYQFKIQNQLIAGALAKENDMKLNILMPVNTEQLTLMFLSTLRRLYGDHRLNYAPMPLGRLPPLPGNAPPPNMRPDLKVLSQMQNVRLRLACVGTCKGDYYLDVLDQMTGYILLVISKSSVNRDFHFKDIYGITHFTARYHNEDILEIVQAGANQNIATIRQGDGFDENAILRMIFKTKPTTATMFTTEQGAKQAEQRVEHLGYSPDQKTLLGQIFPDCFTVLVVMSPSLDVTIKALLLAKAVEAAHYSYNLHKHTAHRVDSYR